MKIKKITENVQVALNKCHITKYLISNAVLNSLNLSIFVLFNY